MKILTVRMSGRVDNDSDFIEIDLEKEVNYIDLWQRTKSPTRVFAYHTPSGSYLGMSTLTEAAAGYAEYGFELFDRSTLVNRNRVSESEPSENNGSIITFVDGSRVTVRKQIL